MDIYIVRGENNCRKSSILRCLTGVGPRRKVMMIVHEGGGQTFRKYVYIQDSSPQDLKEPLSPGKLIEKIAASDVDACVVALRNNRCHGMPDGDDYINAFEGRGWKNIKVLRMEAAPESLGGDEFVVSEDENGMTIRFYKDAANNQMAVPVRKFFGWL